MERHKQENGSSELSFEFRKQRYCYHEQDNAFEKLWYPDKVWHWSEGHTLPQGMLLAFKCYSTSPDLMQEPFDYYWNASGYSNDTKLLAAVENWGPNKFVVPVPSFLAMLQEQLLAPFFVFQTFCVGLWCLDEYW